MKMAGTEGVDEAGENMETVESSNVLSLSSNNDENEPQEQLQTATESHEKLTQLPLARIKNIIKSDPDVKMTSQEAVVVLAKAAELFIQRLVSDTAVKTLSERKKTLTRQHLDHAFFSKDCYSFLEGVLESFDS